MKEEISKSHSLMEWLYKFLKRYWKVIAVSPMAIGVLWLLFKQNRIRDDRSVNSLAFGSRVDPRWKIYQSFSDKKDVYGIMRVRSNTMVGSGAGIMRFCENTDPLIATTLPLTTMSTIDPKSSIYWIDQMKRWFGIIVYRIPRAVREWQLWLTAASYGLIYLMRNGQIDKKEAQSLQSKMKENQVTFNKHITSDSNVIVQSNDQLADQLEQQFDRIMNKPIFGELDEPHSEDPI